MISEKKGKNLRGLRGEAYEKFANNMEDVFKSVSPGFRKLIKEDLKTLHHSQHKVSDLLDFSLDLNNKIKGSTGAKSILNKFKGPIKEAIKDIDPQLGKDFELANSLYRRISKTAKTLSPSEFDRVAKWGKMGTIASSLLKLNPKVLVPLAGVQGAQALTREFIINPKFQNFSTKIAQQIKKNNKKGLLKVIDRMKDYIKKDEPELYNKLKNEPIYTN